MALAPLQEAYEGLGAVWQRKSQLRAKALEQWPATNHEVDPLSQ